MIEFLKLGMKIPKALEIMLQKGVGDEPLPDEGEEITTERIMARRKQLLDDIDLQRTEFVTARTKESEELKKEMAGKDSFADPINLDLGTDSG